LLPTSDRRTTGAARPWIWALMAGALGACLRALLQPLLGDELPFLVALPTAAIAALMWGPARGMAAALVGVAAVAFPVIPPDVAAADRPLQIGGFLISAIILSLACGSFNRAQVATASTATDGRFDTPLTTWLRAVLWGALLIPATAFVVAGWWGFERAKRDAELTASHASALAQSHAQRTFGIAGEIARRADAVAADTDDHVRAHEVDVHRRLADMVAGLPAVVNLNVWDANGNPLARSDLYPVDAGASVADRQYFRDQRTAPRPLGVSEVLVGRQTQRELLNATIRRSSADGVFRGVVAVSLSPSFFREYYASLAAEQPNLASFALIRTDGVLLARWPVAADGRTRVPDDSPVLARVTAGATAGSVVLPANEGREARLVSFRRVGDYPLYVVAGFSRDAMFAGWVRFVGLLAAVLAPVTAGLVYVSWVALKRTRNEQAIAAELRDEIRRRASAERSMLEKQKLETLAILTGGVAHDFNNLLSILSTNLHLHSRLHPAEANEPHLLSMARAVQGGARLTRQLLSFARKQALKPETTKLQAWLPGVEALIRSTLGSRVHWHCEVAPDTSAITVDLAELELAIVNLALNAKHALPDGGDITVSAGNASETTSEGRETVCIAVRDGGVGIPPEVLPRVMEPFFTTRTAGAGSGLGLSQVHGLCVQSGGFLRIESEVGAGTVVRMYFPAVHAPTPGEGDQAGRLPLDLPRRLLVVEDNEEVASSVVAMLRAAGIEIVHAVNANQALRYIETSAEPPDAVLSDISMPGAMNGIDLAFELRRRQPDLPVLLTTGYADHLDEAVRGGFKVVAKPAPAGQLMDELRAAMRRLRSDSAYT